MDNQISLGALRLPANTDHLVSPKTTLSGTTSIPSQLKTLLHPRKDISTPFKCPSNRLLKIKDLVSREKLANPDSLDSEGQPCIVVTKDGCTTDLTVGRCARLESFVCDDNGARSVELAVYNYDKRSRG